MRSEIQYVEAFIKPTATQQFSRGARNSLRIILEGLLSRREGHCVLRLVASRVEAFHVTKLVLAAPSFMPGRRAEMPNSQRRATIGFQRTSSLSFTDGPTSRRGRGS